MKNYCVLFSFLVLLCCCNGQPNEKVERWSKEKANEWYNRQNWIVGCNFIPSSAVNQLEMWQKETFDPTLIDKELGWAEDLGFNAMRVFLHSLAWKEDPDGFKERINQYLTISNKHHIKTCFVFFDDCWNPKAQTGKQPEPKPGVHNSGWVQDPIVSLRADTSALYNYAEPYIKDILASFKNDKRILMWDLYNEPGNSNHKEHSLPLLKKVFEWARTINPSQPLTAGIWSLELPTLNWFQKENSDIITYHSYQNAELHQSWIDSMKSSGYPVICTEWMGRRFSSTFEEIMPILKKQKVGAFSWGFVAGKTNTIFAWDDPRPDGKEPELWFHDILRKDGTPYSEKETEAIKRYTLK